MTQQLQDEFETSVENAEAWMKTIQERLQVNDNTQGPRAALEARLRESEKICNLESEGKVKMDMVLMKAEALLLDSDEDEKHEIMSKLKHVKAMFEDTTTYMMHCHSRIEWVWLHWSEYLRARDEFSAWAHNMHLALEPDVELQLGLKEKQWQLGHGQVLLKDLRNQHGLLERLLEEAAALFNRIGDPSVDEDEQSQMKSEYEDIRTKAEERVKLLEHMVKDHEQYQENVNQFRSWLSGVVEKLKQCVGESAQPTAARLRLHQDIAQDVGCGEKRLKDLEVQSASVVKNTSPLGAEKIAEELEELRRALGKLKLMNNEEGKDLLKAHQSDSAYQARARQLEADVHRFRKAIQRLGSCLEPGEQVKSAEELEALWKKYTAASSALAAEDPKAEALKAQLKELFRFSQDAQPLSASVLAAIQEYQSARGKAFKLCTAAETALRRRFQKPLREFQHWKPAAERLLDATAGASDAPLIQNLLPQIEASLEESSRLREELPLVQQQKDLLGHLLGAERAESVLEEAAHAAHATEALHASLLQRKILLQSSISQSADLDATLESLQKRLGALRLDVTAASESQPDLAGKEGKLRRLQEIQEELLKIGLHVEELEASAQSQPAHRPRISQLSSDCLALKRLLQVKIRMCKQAVSEHQAFKKRLADLQRWLVATSQKLEDMEKTWEEEKEENSMREAESLLADFRDRELQLHRLEAEGQAVADSSSPAGAAHVQGQLEQLREPWDSLRARVEALAGILWKRQQERMANDPGKIWAVSDGPPQVDQLSPPFADAMDSLNPGQGGSAKDRSSGAERSTVDYPRLMKDFEEWLRGESAELTAILRDGASSGGDDDDLQAQRSKLQKLRSRLPDGQGRFEILLQLRPVMGIAEDLRLEDLRYRWMLYKSKLKDASNMSSLQSVDGPGDSVKTRPGRTCAFLQRVCCAALPLQLLLLLLLLLAFLLPLAEETHSCTLANNFARSFKLMLRYEGPPPT
ncbi:nesprin-3 [Rhinatrema bivittatum]|uniref:nesprin-3 n=1 Tax=Rhinatrema bivittatum TaxID=194408 RepID=UPI00112B8393|nr:nesprin-3 [Rhinatrema bivittatum]